MSKITRKITAWLAGYIGSYYFIEVEEKQVQPAQVGLKKYRLVIRAMSTRAALAASYKYCLQVKQRDGKEYELSLIQRI